MALTMHLWVGVASPSALRTLAVLSLRDQTPQYHLHKRARFWHDLHVHWQSRDCIFGRARLSSCVHVRCRPHPRIRQHVRLCRRLHTYTALPLHVRALRRHHCGALNTIRTANLYTDKESKEQEGSLPETSFKSSYERYLRRVSACERSCDCLLLQDYQVLKITQAGRNMWNISS